MITEFKQCNRCGETKSLDEFYSKKKHSKTKGDYIYYNPECKECTKKASAIWVKNNLERHYASKRENDKKPNRVAANRRMMQRYRYQGRQLEWQRNNKDKIKQYQERHRIHDISEKEWVSCKEYFNFECAYCGITDDEAKLEYNNYLHKDHVDHRGANDISNCVPACKVCNSSKHTSQLEDWYNEDNPNYTRDRIKKIYMWLEEDCPIVVLVN